MNKLLTCITKIKCEKCNIVNERLNEFKNVKDVFSELCFCILTANYSAQGGIKIQKEIGNGFLILPEDKLASRLKELGHRFPNARAKYIIEARKQIHELENNIKNMNEPNLREWLVNNIKGLGMKEASHFMRNIGYDNVSIIDFHIIDLLEREGLINKPKNLNKKNYLLIENKLKEISKQTKIPLSGLDLYLWCLETGKILK